jgi:hypothetical protein
MRHLRVHYRLYIYISQNESQGNDIPFNFLFQPFLCYYAGTPDSTRSETVLNGREGGGAKLVAMPRFRPFHQSKGYITYLTVLPQPQFNINRARLQKYHRGSGA